LGSRSPFASLRHGAVRCLGIKGHAFRALQKSSVSTFASSTIILSRTCGVAQLEIQYSEGLQRLPPACRIYP
jgi:hypothetical protein